MKFCIIFIVFLSNKNRKKFISTIFIIDYWFLFLLDSKEDLEKILVDAEGNVITDSSIKIFSGAVMSSQKYKKQETKELKKIQQQTKTENQKKISTAKSLFDNFDAPSPPKKQK